MIDILATHTEHVIQSHLDSHRPLLLDTHVNETAWTTASEALSFSAELSLASKGFPDLSERILDIRQWILLLVVALEVVEKVAHGDRGARMISPA